ncbi:class II D-tagatose-bisphosphate aldolase non-catalytic subunit [Solidesulfovibrio aerotolerans]|nr:class II D-tagatose-bisphosphate aldolase, non-catalytic subunit [Solidesulfovibrio aerotolerans]
MSQNCVDATIELANEYEIPIFLVASRRQIDSEAFGGGYVNNWTTEEFSRYVIDKDKKGKVILARDHGGPWQNTMESLYGLSLRRAMESAKLSFRADIDAGFQVLHIDPSVDIHGDPSADEILDRVFELYEYCWSYAQSQGNKILFEIGTEQQSGGVNMLNDLHYTLSSVLKFCKKTNVPLPLFVVVQNGTKVMETRNIGSFDQSIRVANELSPEIQMPKLVELCKDFNIFMKVHNTDYLSDESLIWYPRLGIHAANVAPEFGIVETKALLEIMHKNSLHRHAERFNEIAFNSRKWEKWVLDAQRTSDNDKSIIAGHYVFSSQEFIELKKEVTHALAASGIHLDAYLKASVKASIMRYLRNFRLVRSS